MQDIGKVLELVGVANKLRRIRTKIDQEVAKIEYVIAEKLPNAKGYNKCPKCNTRNNITEGHIFIGSYRGATYYIVKCVICGSYYKVMR